MNAACAPAGTAVDPLLDTFFAERIARATGPVYQRLWTRIEQASSGGKRLRPHLLLLAHDTLGGTEHDDALIAAAAFELLHTALLLHDDVLDGDLIRRGRPNLQGAFAGEAREQGLSAAASATWGDATGLLAGDLLLSGLHLLISRMQSPHRGALHELVDECLFATAGGELADVGFAVGAVDAAPPSIEQMMHDKTAAYTFAAPLRAGAMLAGADEHLAAELERIGMALGFVYQLRDDLLGVFGTEARLGKTVDGDLREGKRTLLIAFAEGAPEWQAVRPLFGNPDLTQAQAGQLRDALKESGASARAVQLLAERVMQVCVEIEQAALPEELQRELIRLARHSAEREA